jgi:hypothetical protein
MQRRLVYLGGGVAGVGIYGADAIGSDVFKMWPWLRAAFIILALSTGAFIGWAWEPCARWISRIERDHMGELSAKSSPSEELPAKILICNNIALILLAMAAAVLISASILSALDDTTALVPSSKHGKVAAEQPLAGAVLYTRTCYGGQFAERAVRVSGSPSSSLVPMSARPTGKSAVSPLLNQTRPHKNQFLHNLL